MSNSNWSKKSLVAGRRQPSQGGVVKYFFLQEEKKDPSDRGLTVFCTEITVVLLQQASVLFFLVGVDWSQPGLRSLVPSFPRSLPLTYE